MGAGKSTLSAELLRRGLELMADDVLVLQSRGSDAPPLAHPAPPLMTLAAMDHAPLHASYAPPTICSLPERERWVAVPVHREPLPLQALVMLDRRPGAQLEVAALERPLAPLLGSFLSFPRTPERERARFELASMLAVTSTVVRLSADPSVPPEMLADALLDGLPGVQGANDQTADPSDADERGSSSRC
jgi:hypothetical protein